MFEIIGFEWFQRFVWTTKNLIKTCVKPTIHQKLMLQNNGFYWFFIGFDKVFDARCCISLGFH